VDNLSIKRQQAVENTEQTSFDLRRAYDFEKYVTEFLSLLRFHDVAGGRDLKLGGFQIDAVARHEDTLIVVESATAFGKRRLNFRDQITNLRGKIPAIKREIKNNPRYAACTGIRFALASNIQPSSEDIQFAEQNPRVYLWSKAMIEYYSELSRRLGEVARNGLLAELDISPRVGEVITLPCMRLSLSNIVLFSFFIEPKKLLRCAYVARREVTQEHYYQRMIRTDRLRKIAYYVKANGFFPNSIIVAFSPDKQPKYVSIREARESLPDFPKWLDFGVLTFPLSYQACWIVDGQHRLYSFTHVEQSDLKLPVVALENLPIDEQARYFLDINSEQKPVPPDLVWDLQGQLRPDSDEGKISRFAKELSELEPFRGKIYIPRKGLKTPKQLRLSGICNTAKRRRLLKGQTENMTQKHFNPLHDQDPDKMIRRAAIAISEYFRFIVSKTTEPLRSDFVMQNSGVSIFLSLYERLLTAFQDIPSESDFDRYLSPLLENLNTQFATSQHIHALKLRCSSEGGRDEVTDEFVILINDQTNAGLPTSQKIGQGLLRQLMSLEKNLRGMIAEALSKKDPNWMRSRLPADILKYINDRKTGATVEAVDNLTIGQCREIVEREDNWKDLQAIFLDEKVGFGNKEAVLVALTEISRVRAGMVHEKTSFHWKYGDRDLVETYVDKLNKVIDNSTTHIA
jgi:DGQHR domain-containing protein